MSFKAILSKKKKKVPPYFAYIAKAFGVLEGIGLSSDPDYAIVSECLPYISQRLLSDTNPRTGEALKTFIFGPEKDSPDRVIDVDRVELLIKGFSSYSAAASSISNKTEIESKGIASSRKFSEGQAKEKMESNRSKGLTLAQIDRFSDRIIELLLSNPSLASSSSPSALALDSPSLRISSSSRLSRTPLQRLVIEETSKLVGALARQSWRSLRDRSGRTLSGRSILGSLIDPLGLFVSSPLVEVDGYDRRVLESAEKVLRLCLAYIDEEDLIRSLTSIDAQRFASSLLGKLWSKRQGVLNFSVGVTAQTIEDTILRLDKRMDMRRSSSSYDVRPSLSLKKSTYNSNEFPSNKDRLENARKIVEDIKVAGQ
jgi:hypothetical protein